MCGIAGWIVPRAAKWRPSAETVKYWLGTLEGRGKDASGYATITDDENRLFYMKGAVKATEFIKEFDDPEDCPPIGHIGLLHARSWSVGVPSKNFNNHPIVVNQVAVVHNGGFDDHEEIYKLLKIEVPEEVDSAIVPYLFDRVGYHRGLEIMQEKTPGDAAIAAILENGNLLLAKDGRPLFIGRLPEGGFMFSSEVDPCFFEDAMDVSQFAFNGIGRFPMEHYAVIDRNTLKVVDSGDFKLKERPLAGGAGTGRGTGGNYHQHRQTVLCAWGMCQSQGVTGVEDVDGGYKWLCKQHKKKWRRSEKIPNSWEANRNT